jgi:hypothetical protein
MSERPEAQLSWAKPALICSAITGVIAFVVCTTVYRQKLAAKTTELQVTRAALNEASLLLADAQLRLKASTRPSTAPTTAP